MGSDLDQIVEVNITQQTSAVAKASFSIPLIIGPTNAGWSDYVHSYSSPTQMLSDGFTASDPEYIYATKMYAQNTSPNQFLVGKRAASVAQVDKFQITTLTSGHVYSLTLNGVVLTHTATGGDAEEDILGALLTQALAISGSPVSGAVAGTGPSAILTLTSTVAGQAVIYTSINSFISHVAFTANYGIQNDINNVIGQNDTWYGLIVAAASDAEINQASSLIESLKKIFLTASATSAIATAATTDILSILKGRSVKRSGMFYTTDAIDGKEAAWMGQNLPLTPGSNNWAYNTLANCDIDVLTSNQVNILIGNPVAGIAGKNGNIYRELGGQNVTQMGQMAGGQYIDITIGIDWLEAEIQSNLYQAFVSASQAGAKIPYTDNGAAILVSCVKAALDQGVTNGLIDGSSILISVPLVSSIPLTQRANRIGPPIKFSCRLTGAINSVIVNGNVSV